MLGLNKISKANIKLIEKNRDRVQEWFDSEPLYNVTDAGIGDVNLPNFVILWGGSHLKSLALHTSMMSKKYKRHEEDLTFIFWDVDVGEAIKRLLEIEIPKFCIACGKEQNLNTEDAKAMLMNTIPETTSYYNLPVPVKVTYYKCSSCEPSIHLRLGYQSDSQFLVATLSQVKSPKVYRAVVDHYADSIVPYFSIKHWKQVSKDELVTTLKRKPRK